MNDYRQGIDELNYGNYGEIPFFSEKDKLIHYEGDLSKDPSVSAPKNSAGRGAD